MDTRVLKFLRRAFVLLLVFGTMPPLAPAQKVGSTSMQFLKVMPCARATAMGDAYSVLASGAEAMFWNPSGLAQVQGQELSSTYVWWIMDTRQGALSYGASLGGFGSVGLQVQYVDFGTMEETSLERPYINKFPDPGMTGNTFHPFSYLVGLSYARSLTDRFSVGLSAKYAHESLYNGATVTAMVSDGVYENVKTWANGLLFDLGMRYDTGYRTVRLGASVQNFGADVTYAKESSPVPLLFRFGVAADLAGRDALLMNAETSRLTVAVDLFQPNDYAQQEHVGVEYEYDGVFALRGGYKFNYDSEGLTLGGGVRTILSNIRLAIDYSYGSVGQYLGNVQRISLGVGF